MWNSGKQVLLISSCSARDLSFFDIDHDHSTMRQLYLYISPRCLEGCIQRRLFRSPRLACFWPASTPYICSASRLDPILWLSDRYQSCYNASHRHLIWQSNKLCRGMRFFFFCHPGLEYCGPPLRRYITVVNILYAQSRHTGGSQQ